MRTLGEGVGGQVYGKRERRNRTKNFWTFFLSPVVVIVLSLDEIGFDMQMSVSQ